MTTLSEFVCVMNVRTQSCQSSVTCLSQFCDWSCKLVAVQHWHVRHQIQAPIQRWSLPPTICMRFFVDFVIFSLDLHALLTWWSAHTEWGEYTLINSTRCLLTVIDVAMARSLMQSVQLIRFRQVLFTNVPTPCMFVLEFSSNHDYLSLLCPSNLGFVSSPCLAD